MMALEFCNAPATFERLMEHVLKRLHWKPRVVYLDDVIILEKIFEEHMDFLKDVCQTIVCGGLKLSPKK